MDNLMIEKTKSTPYISFDATTGQLQLEGESYPENVVKFYTQVLDWLRAYLENSTVAIIMEFKVPYFNSSTSKVFMTIFDLFEQQVIKGRPITIHWICDEDNDVAIECGEEFKEDLTHLSFIIQIC